MVSYLERSGIRFSVVPGGNPSISCIALISVTQMRSSQHNRQKEKQDFYKHSQFNIKKKFLKLLLLLACTKRVWESLSFLGISSAWRMCQYLLSSRLDKNQVIDTKFFWWPTIVDMHFCFCLISHGKVKTQNCFSK